MLKLYFNFKDVFRAARLGFSPKKIWVFFCGLLYGVTMYNVFSYLAHLAAGRPVADTWAMFGLVPLPWSDFNGWSWLLWALGGLLFMVTYMLAAAVVAKITAEQLSGNEFYETKEGIDFLKQSWKSILGAPLVIGIFITFILVGGLLLGLWGKIPYVGELTVSLVSLPVYFVCLFLVFLFLALVVALWYAPVISGSTKSDTFDNLFEIFSAITSQPWRLVVYSGLLKLVAFAGFLIFGWFTYQALFLAYRVLGGAMGDKFLGLAAAAFNIYTPPMVLNVMLGFFQGFGMDQSFYLMTTPALSWAGNISAFLMGMSLNLIRLAVISYAAASLTVGQTIIYGIIVMKRDERNIFEPKEEPPVQKAENDEECEAPESKTVHKAAKAAKKVFKAKPAPKAKK